MPSTTTTSVAAQSSSHSQPRSHSQTLSHSQTRSPAQSSTRPNPIAHLSQSMNIRYELCRRTGHLKSLYRDGYSVTGYDTIDRFYVDMAAEGWQVESTQQARSCSLHFAVLKRTF